MSRAIRFKRHPYTWYFIENELRHYHELKRQLKELTDDIIFSGGGGDGQPKGNNTSDPTSQKAVKLMSSTVLLELTRRVKAMDYVYDKLSDDEKKFFELYFTRNRSIIYISSEIGLAERTSRMWRDLIIKATMRNYGFDTELV